MQKQETQKTRPVKTMLKGIKAKVNRLGITCFFRGHRWRYPYNHQKNCSRCGMWWIRVTYYDISRGHEKIIWKKMKI